MKKYTKYLASFRRYGSLFLLILATATLIGTQFYSVQASALTQDQLDAIYQWPFWAPNTCGSTPVANTALNITAAENVAKKYNKGNTQVGFSLYNSDGGAVGNYNSTFKNYGASITKAMILVAYLKQVGNGTLSTKAINEMTNMIEISDNASADWVYDHITDAPAKIQAVATAAGMTGFKLNDTSDPVYVLGQSKVTAQDFAMFFAHINLDFPAAQQGFALGLLSHLSAPDQNGLLKSGLPGTVYSKEGWKPENAGLEGAPYVVNQAAQFSENGQTYGVAVTVGGTADQATGDAIIEKVVAALSQASTTAPGTTETSPEGTSIAQSANAKEVFIFMTDNGFDAAQAAGILGNLWIESTLNPTATNTQDGIHYGLAQWGGARLPAMKAWVTADGKATDSVVGQQAFIIHELDTDYSNVKSAVLQDSTPASAAADWNTLYEGSGDTTDNREEAANSMYQAFASLAGTPQTTVASSGCSSSSTSPDCTGSVTGNAEILCTAQQYAGIFYLWGGGHDGYANFKAKCTAQVLSNASKTSTAGDPGPCATDCSGLVSMSVDQAFNQTQDWTVASLQADTSDWTKIPMSSIQPGDVVTVASEHVEIVDFYDASTGTVHTFGSHYTGVTTGPTSSPTSYWTGGAYRYKGPTS